MTGVQTCALPIYAKGVVLIVDGNPFAEPGRRSGRGNVKRDGFSEIRQQLQTLAGGFPGKVLLVHGATQSKPQGRQQNPTGISWRGNLGIVEASAPWIKIDVDSAQPALLTMAPPPDGDRAFARN